MDKVKVELDKDGIKELLTSPAVIEMITGMGESKFNMVDASKGYELRTGITHSTGTLGERAFAAIVAVEFRARKDNAENNTLLKIKGG